VTLKKTPTVLVKFQCKPRSRKPAMCLLLARWKRRNYLQARSINCGKNL